MKEKIEKKLQELKEEWKSGQKMLNNIAIQQQELEQTLLRISGAIQVLEEIITTKDEEQ